MTPRLTIAWLREYVRRPLNVALLILVPVVFVLLSAGALANFADVLAGGTNRDSVELATAGWAASILAGVGAFFHVAGSRHADRRLASTGMRLADVVGSRVLSSAILGLLAVVASVVALWLRVDVVDPTRVIVATLLSAAIYVGIGITVGAFVRSEFNGSLAIVFAWMFDVFFGPAMGGTAPVLRVFPLHYPTLILTDATSTQSGIFGNIGLSIVWAIGSLVVGVVALAFTTAPRRRAARRSVPVAAAVETTPEVPSRSPGWVRRVAALRAAGIELRRMPAMWLLVVGLPVAFISASIAVTPNTPTMVSLREGGRTVISAIPLSSVHGAIMVPITVGFLASLAGLFVVLDSAEADRRLSLTSLRAGEILSARMVVVAGAALLATAVSLGVTAVDFTPQQWGGFVLANVLVALTYGAIGVLVGPIFGRLGGLYLLLVLPFIDIGVAQNPMFDAAPPAWGRYLPSHGAVRVLIDAAFTPSFDETGAVVLAVAWLVGLVGLAAVAFHRIVTT